MARFRKRVVIDAFRLGVDAPSDWFNKAFDNGRVQMLPGPEALIRTPEGTELASKGDFIFQDATGDISHLPPDEFDAIYEAA
jgi:hypothetical protein